jgi:hypothetical protein
MVTELRATIDDLPRSGILREKGPFRKIEDFFGAIEDAKEGDLITLANNDKPYVVKKVPPFRKIRGTAENPVIVRAEEPGKVILEGSAGYKFVNCTFFTWYGFHHAHKSASGNGNISFEGGNNNRFARCEVNLVDGNNRSKRHWLRISNSDAIKVDHCYFHDKNSVGQFCNVNYVRHIEPEKGPVFEYNYFQNQLFKHPDPDKQGDAGGEAIQMGDSKFARWYYRAIVCYNYFEQCNGDGEIIANKSSGNLYYNNTFTDSNGSITLRHGESTAVLGNYFKNCGLRVAGADNLIANNHFTENSRGSLMLPVTIHNGNIERPDGPYPTNPKRNYERVVNNDIILNTFANGEGKAKQIVLWGGKRNLMPYNNRFRGNIITGKNGMLFEFDRAKPSFEAKINGEEKMFSNDISDNIAWTDGREGDKWYGGLTEKMADRIDPKLERNADGVHRIPEDSKARRKFEGTPFEAKTAIDIYGMNRIDHIDAGCHQFSTEPNTPNRPVSTDDVGVSAPTPWKNSPKWDPPSKGKGKKS